MTPIERRPGVRAMLVLATMALLAPCVVFGEGGGMTATGVGLGLQQLPAADLDAIERAVGHRVGVMVAQVSPGSPAEAAGVKPGDILFAVAGQGVASPEAVDQALAGAQGQVPLGLIRMEGGNAQIVEVTLGAVQAAPQGGFGPFGGTAPGGAPAGGLPGGGHQQQPAGTVGGQAGRVVTSPLGVAYTVPADWQTQESPNGTGLLPPDVVQGPQGPLEFYVFASLPAEGVTTATDPRVEQALDGLVAEQVPFMQRASAAEPVAAGSIPGIGILWEGVAPNGVTMRARAYAAVVGAMGVVFCGVGERQAVANRDAALRAIFSTLTAVQVQRDPNLAGTWFLLETRTIWNADPSVSSGDRAKLASDDKNWLTLNPDGTALLVTQHYMIAGGAGVWLEDKNEKKTAGQWAAAGGVLQVAWEDGSSSQYQYELFQAQNGVGLRLSDGRNATTWARQ